MYHNTFLTREAPWRNYYLDGLGGHVGRDAPRRIFNNILIQSEQLAGLVFSEPPCDLQADANLHWSARSGSEFAGDFFAAFRNGRLFAASKEVYPPGLTMHDLFADPKFIRYDPEGTGPEDYGLQQNSPAIDAGVPIPPEWPDPLRAMDKGKPDVGAIPFRVEMWRIGVNGRFNLAGEEK